MTLILVITYEKLANSKIMKLSQDNNRKKALLLVVIYTILAIISPVLIYQKKWGNPKSI